MAKMIQGLQPQTPNNVCIATLGWPSMETYIKYIIKYVMPHGMQESMLCMSDKDLSSQIYPFRIQRYICKRMGGHI